MAQLPGSAKSPGSQSTKHVVWVVLTGFAVAAVLYIVLNPDNSSRSVGLTAAEHGYVGINECAGCHSEITASYRQTAMGRSFGVADAETEMGDFSQNNTYFWEHRGRHYEMSNEDGNLHMTSYALDQQGNKIRQRKNQITHWLGSGEHFRGYLSLQGSNYERLHMSWYGHQKEWAPFALREYGGPPDERLGYNCFYCHSRYPTNAVGAKWTREVIHFPEPLQWGAVDCERCHGPGQAHVRLAKVSSNLPEIRKSIVNPKHLPQQRQLDVCAQCHLEPTTRIQPHRIVMPGKTPFSFRPGESLDDHFAVFDFEDPAMHHHEDTHLVNQSYELSQSTCYQKSGDRMTCTTCHDPHRTPPRAQRADYFRGKCLTCHADDDCVGVEPELRGTSDCVKCHMPPTYTVEAIRAVVHPHRIARSPNSNMNKPVEERLAHLQTALVPSQYGYRLKLYYPHQSLSSDQRELLLEIGHLLNQNDQVRSRWGNEKLEAELDRLGMTSPEILRKLGLVYMAQGNVDKARIKFREALDLVPGFLYAKVNLAETERGRPAQALPLYREVLQQSPLNLRAHRGVTESLMGLGLQQQARQVGLPGWLRAIDEHIDIQQPTHLGYDLIDLGLYEDALSFFQQAIQINPADWSAKEGLEHLLKAHPELRKLNSQ